MPTPKGTQIQTEDHPIRLILEIHPVRLILEQFPERLVLELHPVEHLLEELKILKQHLKNAIERAWAKPEHVRQDNIHHRGVELFLVRDLIQHPEYLKQCLELGQCLEQYLASPSIK
jgi:hypothetical protein